MIAYSDAKKGFTQVAFDVVERDIGAVSEGPASCRNLPALTSQIRSELAEAPDLLPAEKACSM
jgi:hypothetical protein